MSNLCKIKDEEGLEKDEEESWFPNNRIFLNFTRELRESKNKCFTIDKVKKLFQLLSQNEKLQEMKTVGCQDKDELDEEEDCDDEEEEEEEEDEDEIDFGRRERKHCVDSGKVGRGHVFAMSRDFWYTKLNILKAHKLDEVALKAKDVPGEDRLSGESGAPLSNVKTHRNNWKEVDERGVSVFREIEEFEKRVVKLRESEPEAKFTNIYENKVHFCHKSGTHLQTKTN